MAEFDLIDVVRLSSLCELPTKDKPNLKSNEPGHTQ
jgi:hypothetical protein